MKDVIMRTVPFLFRDFAGICGDKHRCSAETLTRKQRYRSCAVLNLFVKADEKYSSRCRSHLRDYKNTDDRNFNFVFILQTSLLCSRNGLIPPGGKLVISNTNSRSRALFLCSTTSGKEP
ncbi:hypothetical protein BaRGS_00014349 [Batillaria attramentaria]|uniref:Uncharacterized protein n=1 Tax=Batillaria attramentaria TaxID=370345 RepID=A0ABD0L5U8_9CAEN